MNRPVHTARVLRCLPCLTACMLMACEPDPASLNPDDALADGPSAWATAEILESAHPELNYAPMQTAKGVMVVPWVERDGYAVVGGDWVIGTPADMAMANTYGVVLNEVWRPDGTIDWYNNGSIPASKEDKIKLVFDYFELASPLSIQQIDPADAHDESVRFMEAGVGESNYVYGYWKPSKTFERKVRLSSYNYGTVAHEFGHVLGFPHEHQRADRDDHVDLTNCYLLDFGDSEVEEFSLDGFNYAKANSSWGATDLGRFDFESVMLYDCVRGLDGSGVVETPTYRKSNGSDLHNTLSANDINAIYRVYGAGLDDNETGDQFSEAMATGDFDNDGFTDIAIATRDDIAAGNADRVVHFYRGVEDPGGGQRAYVPWFREVVAEDVGVNTSIALAAGDFNDDGIDDLAVGQPWANAMEGRVRVLFVNTDPTEGDKWPTSADMAAAPWGMGGVAVTVDIEATDVGLPAGISHRFGASLAVGRIATTPGNDYHDLVVGAPGAQDAQAVWPSNAGGAVVLLQGSRVDSPSAWERQLDSVVTYNPSYVSGSSGHRNADFGYAVAVVPNMCEDDTGGTHDVIAVGAPSAVGGRGQVALLGCSWSVTPAPHLVAPALLDTQLGAHPNAQLGKAMDGYRTLNNGERFFVVAGSPTYEPGDNTWSGRVELFEYDHAGAYVDKRVFTPPSADVASAMGFGSSVAVRQGAVGDWEDEVGSHDVELAIGAPGARDASNRTAGRVYVWHPYAADGSDSWTKMVVNPTSSTTGTNTDFGATLVTLDDYRNHGGFVFGAPLGNIASSGGQVDAGYAVVWRDTDSASHSFVGEVTRLHQKTAGDHRPDNL